MNPFMGVSLMDDFFHADPSNGFSSISSISSFSNGSGNGATKRTSTSTTFVNGKKLMTRKWVRNGAIFMRARFRVEAIYTLM